MRVKPESWDLGIRKLKHDEGSNSFLLEGLTEFVYLGILEAELPSLPKFERMSGGYGVDSNEVSYSNPKDAKIVYEALEKRIKSKKRVGKC